jgi:hypothetical protein
MKIEATISSVKRITWQKSRASNAKNLLSNHKGWTGMHALQRIPKTCADFSGDQCICRQQGIAQIPKQDSLNLCNACIQGRVV